MEQPDRATVPSNGARNGSDTELVMSGVHPRGEDNNEPTYADPSEHDPYKDADRLAYEIFDWIKRQEFSMVSFVQALVSVGLLAVTFSQLVVSCSGSRQTDQLIAAATSIQRSADKFSLSATQINSGIADAVGKLNDQAGQLKGNVTQTSRLATDAEVANSNVIAADRPWMGGVLTSVADFDKGKKASFSAQFVNSGKRPARVTFSAMLTGWFAVFPADADAVLASNPMGDEPSTNVVVPGQAVGLSTTLDTPLDPTVWDWSQEKSPIMTYYVFAEVNYTDLRTNDTHWTHICYRFYPKYRTGSDNGFRNCKEYNDAN